MGTLTLWAFDPGTGCSRDHCHPFVTREAALAHAQAFLTERWPLGYFDERTPIKNVRDVQGNGLSLERPIQQMWSREEKSSMIEFPHSTITSLRVRVAEYREIPHTKHYLAICAAGPVELKLSYPYTKTETVEVNGQTYSRPVKGEEVYVDWEPLLDREGLAYQAQVAQVVVQSENISFQGDAKDFQLS